MHPNTTEEQDRLTAINEAYIAVGNKRIALAKAKTVAKYCKADLDDAIENLDRVIRENAPDLIEDRPLFSTLDVSIRKPTEEGSFTDQDVEEVVDITEEDDPHALTDMVAEGGLFGSSEWVELTGDEEAALGLSIVAGQADVVPRQHDPANYQHQPISVLDDIAPTTRESLDDAGFETIGDLIRWDRDFLFSDVAGINKARAKELAKELQWLINTDGDGKLLNALKVKPSKPKADVTDRALAAATYEPSLESI
jgi:hypothetical protein